jgi:hypothetical protein
MQTETFLTPPQLAARYQGALTTRTLANWRSTGNGPRFTKVGGRVLYPLSAVVVWEATRTKADAAPRP